VRQDTPSGSPGPSVRGAEDLAAAAQPALSILHLAIWFGLLTGETEVILVAAKKFLLHRMVLGSPQVAWMAPAMYLAIFALVAGLLLAAGRLRSRDAFPRIAFGVFAFLSCFSVLLVSKSLHRGAVLLLAAGVAVRAAQLFTTHRTAVSVFVRRTTPALLVCAVASTAVVNGVPWIRERLALAGLSAAPGAGPNVLFIVLDTVRAQSLSLYGYPRPTTPRLSAFARRGAVFERAVATASWTLPSHASMFTGRLLHETAVTYLRPLDRRFPMLAELFHRQGYLTAGFVANTMYCSRESGLARGFTHYEDYPWISAADLIDSSSLARFLVQRLDLMEHFKTLPLSGRKTAARVNRDLVEWLALPRERPFFVFLNYMDAHDPYPAPEPFGTRFGVPFADRDPWVEFEWQWGERQIAGKAKAYDASLAYLDDELGSLFGELDKRGLLDSTLVIVTSDHGESLGDHRLIGHGKSLYMSELRVPLVITFPGRVPAGKRIAEPVSLRDLAATIVELSGIEDRGVFPGRSLAVHWEGDSLAHREPAPPVVSELRPPHWAPLLPRWYPVRHGEMRSAVAGRHHYIRNGDTTEELYDLEQDPEEAHDLAATDEGRRALPALRAAIHSPPRGPEPEGPRLVAR
jgi:arylsulfatase A-like enzyme